MPPAFPDPIRTPDGFDLQGHRGARGRAPENTIPAFRRALDLGVTTLEMDVVVAGDGTVVVSHEPWMRPTLCRTPEGERIAPGTGRRHNIYEMTYEQVAAYDCGGHRHPDDPEQTPEPAVKPRLRNVIEEAETYVTDSGRSPVFYNVEIKSRPEWEGQYHPSPDAFVERVLAVVETVGVAPRTTLQSFDVRVLEAIHARTGGVRTALLVSERTDDGIEKNLDRLSFRPDVYSPKASLVDEALVAAVRTRGMALIPWTVNEPDAMRRLLALGVDGFITDDPGRAQAVLREKDR
ncbi:MAG: glycerophosphodiester phosphodiesterase family protein [Salinibacter sp.]